MIAIFHIFDAIIKRTATKHILNDARRVRI